MTRQIAALFVLEDGPYANLPGVEAWGVSKDARLYTGPHPVIAHPPCERWGRYWFGGPSVRERRKLGDDDGCFESALKAVRTFGGVLEHPEASHAFKQFGLPIPAWNGGWTEPDAFGGRACCVAQGHYGHKARKMTWLYGVNIDFRELIWGAIEGRPSSRRRLSLERGAEAGNQDRRLPTPVGAATETDP